MEKTVCRINGLKKALERIAEDDPEEEKGLNFAGSNETILLYNSSETAHMFVPIIRNFLTRARSSNHLLFDRAQAPCMWRYSFEFQE